MKTRTIFFLLICLALVSCTSSNNKSRPFAPQVREHDCFVASYNESTNVEIADNTSLGIKLSVMVPSDESLSASQMRRIENKIIQMTSPFGVIGNGESNPKHILAPVLDLISINATSSAPTRYVAKYNLTYYAADVVSGTVFNSLSQQVSGIGLSKEEAFINAVESMTLNQAFNQFMNTTQSRILSYFKENGDALCAEANTMNVQQNYAGAIALLESIPSADSIHFAYARKLIDQIVPKYLKAVSDDYLTRMKVAITSSPKDTISIVALEYYQMIPTDSPCKSEADKIYRSYLEQLSSEQAAKTERKMKELEADNEFRLREAELKAEVEGNAMLLEKYKKDAAYDRLPWLRKLIYLGDKDPFDGYEPKHNI